MPVALGLLALGFGVYAVRRWRDLGHEIAERKRTEQALRASEQRHLALLAASERQAQDLVLLNRVIVAAASVLEPTAVLAVVCEELARTFNLPQAAAALLDPDQANLTVVAEYCAEGRPHALHATISVRDNPLTQYVMTHRTPLAVPDVQTDPGQAAFQEMAKQRGAVSLLILPLIIRNQIVGTIGLDAIERREFSAEEIALAETVATAAGRALENAYLYAEIQHELNERKRIERLKDEFVATVSHELRTPLTSIRGALGLIAGGVTGEIPAQTMAMIEIARTNSERLLRLINDFLDIEKIEAGKMAFTLWPLQIMPLVEQAIAANRAYGEQFGVIFVLEHVAPGATIATDSDRLMQVLNNLLSNAAKFSPPGGTVYVAVACREGTLRIGVRDRGPGIPAEFRSRIFQKFAQADSSDTRQKGGTGLGLSIAKAIVERLGGQIGYETELSVGTTFYVDLPLAA
ncbi:MAG: ATP-binding protein [Roseiflexaceae bacterium]